MLQVNQPAPDFNSIDEAGNPLRLADFKGQNNLVLYFYPKDDTPGCTIEANQFTSLIDEFSALDTVIIGVSKDSCDSHQAFIDKFGLKVRLMSDETGEVCAAYDTWREKERDGVKRMGINRATFIIDRQGLLRSVEYDVSADGHAQRVLDFVRENLAG